MPSLVSEARALELAEKVKVAFAEACSRSAAYSRDMEQAVWTNAGVEAAVGSARRVILGGEILGVIFAFLAGALSVLPWVGFSLWGFGIGYLRGLGLCCGALSVECLLCLIFLSQFYDLRPRRNYEL